MEEEQSIPAKSEWPNLSVNQLTEVKIQLMDKYFAMRQINASFAAQYEKFIRELDVVIDRKNNTTEEE